MDQRTPEWFAARLGKVTASRVADVMARTKTGESASRKNYLAELVVERLTGRPAEGYTNAAMQWGIDTEPQARAAYEMDTGDTVTEVGFVNHPDMFAGASPDGLCGDDGLVEIKCPNTATHIETLLSGEIPAKYVTQMQWQMACTGRQWCDFVSFDPRLPGKLQLFVKRCLRDDELIGKMETEVAAFLCEVGAKVDALKSKTGDDDEEV